MKLFHLLLLGTHYYNVCCIYVDGNGYISTYYRIIMMLILNEFVASRAFLSNVVLFNLYKTHTYQKYAVHLSVRSLMRPKFISVYINKIADGQTRAMQRYQRIYALNSRESFILNRHWPYART